MPLSAGEKLGPYEIVAPLGAGGMGEVYRARDTRLGRDVALKVLPVDLAGDATRRARFEQEARLLAALNHPNILGIHDIGDSYVVMELVEGSTLRGAQLPLRKVLDIGAQIAEGLATAHGAGITHRDLKPDNVMVTKDGRVKILDFGLAKVNSPKGGEKETRTAHSDPGAVMGTVGYMSPEQVRAQGVDARSDIFSLGVLLHELIRGERPFLGDSVAETMTAIVKTDAPPLPEATPSGVVRVIEGCLAKQPEERWQSARDLARQLRWLADGGTSTSTQKPVPVARQRPWGWIAATALALIGLGLAFVHFRQTPPEAPLMEFLVQPPDKATSLENPTISPDGRTLAFTATVEGKRQLWIRPLDSVSARPLAGTESAYFPFWSPDNRFLGFFTQTKLKKVEVSGGVTQTVCDAAGGGRGGAWNREGLIVFSAGNRSPLSKVLASGGTPTAVTALGNGELTHRWPQFLPDGQNFLYLSYKDSDRDQCSVFAARLNGPAQSNQHQHLVRAGVMAHYSDGFLLFLREDATLVAQSFDIGGGIPSGEAVSLGANIARRSGQRGLAEYSASSNGVLAYLSGGGDQSRLEWRDRTGQLLSNLGEAGYWRDVALSHDGRLVAARRDDTQSNSDLWLHDVARNTSTRFTSDPSFDGLPVWSQDSSRIFFSCLKGGGGLYVKDASSATEEKLLLKATPAEQLYPWSFDGRHLLYSVLGQKGNRSLWVLSLDGEPRPAPFLQATDFEETRGQFSPDGRWVAYQSNESGRHEIYVREFPGAGGKSLVSVAGGTQPRWRRDGREIYYVAPGDKLMAVEVKPSGAALEVGSPNPEQFEGKEADTRSDIWAFGAVLYEMVTGEKAFQGKSYSSLVGAILSADPRPMLVKPFTPPALERLVRRCLAKEPEDRYQSMRDVVLDLRMPPQEPAAMPARTSRWPWVVAAVCLVVAALAVGWSTWMRKPSEPALSAKFDVNPPEGSQFGSILNEGGSAISPDGRTLAFVATNAKGETLLHVRPLESLQARALPGTQEAGRPFWSPDSKSLAFVAGGKLKRIEVAGDSPTTLCDAGYARGGTWNEDGVIVFGDQTPGLQRIPASGGTPSPVTRVNKEAGEMFHYYPQFLPGGKQFLYLARHVEAEKMGIYIGSLDGKAPATRILQTQFKAEYDAGSRRLLYLQGAGVLMAQRLELDPPRLTGDPATVSEGVRNAFNNGYAEFSVSRNGTLFYGQGNAGEKVRFGWRDRAGKLLGTICQPVEARFKFSLSPDESRVAYFAGHGYGQSDIWVLERGLSTRVTFSNATWPQWSPDGQQLYYTNSIGIHRKAADGSGEEELLMKGSPYDYVQRVSPDGKFLLYGNANIMMLPLTGERKSTAYLQTKYRELSAVFSPDGRWVAYHSDESGRNEIYVQGFPERHGKSLVSAEGGHTPASPAWRADGKEVYWVGLDGTLMAASMELQAAGIRPGRAEALFRLPAGEGRDHFQPARDGRRFLVYEPEGAPQNRPMVVVENWAGRLGR